MADISTELAKFRSAVFGEEMRGSMISAIVKMNEEASHAEAWATGGSGGTPSASNNAQAYATQANARGKAWADGVQPDGSALPDDDPAKGNSAKDWAEAAAQSAEEAETAIITGEAALANEAPVFDAAAEYSAGEYVINDNVLYRFTEDHAAGAWTGTDADAVNLGSEINNLQDKISSIDDALYDKTTVTTPYTLGIDAQIKASVSDGGYVVTGTHNKALLYPLKQGTFTVNGLTVKVSNNTITVDGTATASTYFSLRQGAASDNATMANEGITLPNRTWYTSHKVLDGYITPVALYFRKKDNSGNVSLSTTPAVYDTSTFGGLGFFVANGTEVHRGSWFSIGDTDALTYVATLSERVEWLKTSGTVYAMAGDYILADAESAVTLYSVKGAEKSPKFRYSTRTVPNNFSTEVVDIYIPMEDGYVDYIFVHGVNGEEASGGGNVWRLGQIVKVDDSMAQEYFITALGETEMALKIEERGDFIGGTTHGDEWLKTNSFLALRDDEVVDITDFTDYTDFANLTFFAVNTLYDPSSHTTVVGEHGVQWTFSKEGLDLRQNVHFFGSYNMVGSHFTMICAIRNAFSTQTLQITDTYVDDLTAQNWDVSEPGFTTYPNTFKQGVEEVYLLGTTLGIQIKVEYLSQTKGLNGQGNYLYNGAAYNKLYNTICGYKNAIQPVTNGTVWKARSKISVTVV